MRKKRNKRKGGGTQARVPIKPSKYIQQNARKYPVYECWIDEDWEENQYSPVFVSRKKPNGRFILGVYIVDMRCLGVKETDYQHDLSQDEYEENLDMYLEDIGTDFIKIDPNLCFNIIYGAIEFAEDCGFSPHKDFAVSKYILDDVEAIEYVDVPFGRDGKPFFIAGPFDNVPRILATLKKHVGEGNFYYEVPVPGEERWERAEVGDLFPEETIEKKRDSLPEAEGLHLNTMLNIAATILMKANFDMNLIKAKYEEYEKGVDVSFFEETLVELLEPEEMTQKKIQLHPTEEYDFRYLTEWVFEKIIEFEGAYFLWQPDFEPLYSHLKDEELEKLTDEEKILEEKKMMSYMSKRQQRDYYIRKLFIIETQDVSFKKLIDQKNQAKVVSKFLKSMKKGIFKESWNDDLEKILREVAWNTLKKWEYLGE